MMSPAPGLCQDFDTAAAGDFKPSMPGQAARTSAFSDMPTAVAIAPPTGVASTAPPKVHCWSCIVRCKNCGNILSLQLRLSTPTPLPELGESTSHTETTKPSSTRSTPRNANVAFQRSSKSSRSARRIGAGIFGCATKAIRQMEKVVPSSNGRSLMMTAILVGTKLATKRPDHLMFKSRGTN